MNQSGGTTVTRYEDRWWKWATDGDRQQCKLGTLDDEHGNVESRSSGRGEEKEDAVKCGTLRVIYDSIVFRHAYY